MGTIGISIYGTIKPSYPNELQGQNQKEELHEPARQE